MGALTQYTKKQKSLRNLVRYLEGRTILDVEVDDETGTMTLYMDAGSLVMSGDRVSALFYTTNKERLH